MSFEYKLQDFQVSLEDVEQFSGLVFFPNFVFGKASDLCSTDGCKMMSKERMDMITFGRRLRNASSSDLLGKVWEEMKDSKIMPDSFTTEIYERRKKELQELDLELVNVKEKEEKLEGKDEN